jgi:hypothetical protein
MQAQKPAEGIMIQKDWGKARSYTVACDCGDHEHNAHMWIEVSPEADVQDITLTFYVQTTNKWWDKNRFKQIWEIITKGYTKNEATVILSKQGALNLSTVIRNSVNDLSKK